jgi:hypothetical protein
MIARGEAPGITEDKIRMGPERESQGERPVSRSTASIGA